MGVAAARRSRVRPAAAGRRAYRMPDRPAGRFASQGIRGAHHIHVASPLPGWVADERKTVWARLQDDRDLIRLKVLLLTSLAVLTALLEWAA